MSAVSSARIAKDGMLGIRSKTSGAKTSSTVQHATRNEIGRSTAVFAKIFGLLGTNIKLIKNNSLSVDFVRCGFILIATECLMIKQSGRSSFHSKILTIIKLKVWHL